VFNRGKQQQKSQKLAEAFKPIRGAFIATAIFSFFINLLMFTTPLYMLQMYDRVLGSRNETTLVMLTIVAGGALLLFGVLEMVRSRILVRIGAKFDDLLNKHVFRAAFQASVTNPGSASSQSLRDLDSVREFMTGQGLIAFLDAPWVPVFLGVVFLFHPILGFVALAGALIIFIFALSNEFATRKPLGEASKSNVQVGNFVSTSLRNAEAVSAMGMLPGIMDRWRRRHRGVLERQAMASDRAGMILASSKAVRQFLQVSMLGTGAYLVLQGEITPGTMIAGSIMMGRALSPVEQAVGQWRSFVNTRSAYSRLNQLLLQVDQERDHMPLPTPEGRITVERAVVAPPGSRTPVLKGVSFDLQPGEALGVIGPSGAGKSSLARALVGVWPIAQGHVRIDGADITDWSKEQLGPHLGYVPQDVELFDGTVAENIARFQEVDPDEVVRAAQLAGVHELILRLPNGYDTQIGPSGQSLSGGQRQRVALARALYGDVRFVLLDEPNANLDTEGEKALTEAITRLREQGRTMAMITHRPQLLSSVDKVLALDDGQVQAFGPRQEVLSRYTRPSVVSGGGQGGQGQGGGQGQVAARPQGQGQGKGQAKPAQGTPSAQGKAAPQAGQRSNPGPQGNPSQGASTPDGQQGQASAQRGQSGQPSRTSAGSTTAAPAGHPSGGPAAQAHSVPGAGASEGGQAPADTARAGTSASGGAAHGGATDTGPAAGEPAASRAAAADPASRRPASQATSSPQGEQMTTPATTAGADASGSGGREDDDDSAVTPLKR
jgi:PrtD family type I secretion system ABC transporter